jgi:bacillithiol biosynthesis cysteine-adding enzyme BshC
LVFEANDPACKPLVADLLARELEDRPTARLAGETAAAMSALGHAPQVEMAADAVALFYLDAQGRHPIRRAKDGDAYTIGEATRSREACRQEALDHPERFSPNVLLRPIVQDRLFPTICYVAGPAELAYQAQIGRLYREFGVEAPLLYARGSATLIDSAAARFLDRSGLPLETLQPQDDGTLNRLLQQQLPADVERALGEIEHLIATRVSALGSAVTPIDPTLSGAVDTTAERMRETLKTLQNKIVQAAKRKDETLRRQFTRTRALVFPDGDPQERALGIAFFINRYGLALGERLLDTLPLETDKHYVLTL